MAQHPRPESPDMDVATMRRNVAELHEKINARLMATFKGTLEERIIKTDSAGTEFLVNKY